MTDPDAQRIDDRLTDLEVKVSFLDDLVDRLNEVIVQQQDRIDLLVQEVTRLKQQSASAEPAAFRSLRDALPPHY